MSLVVWSGSEQGRLEWNRELHGRKEMAKQGTIALKMVIPIISRGVEEKAMLEEDLKQMGCHGLMLQSWSIKYEKIVQELLQQQGK